MTVNKEIPKNRYDPIYKYRHMKFTGQSFLIQPQPLLFNAYKYTNRDISIYLALASLRSLAEYKLNNTLTLDLFLAPINLKSNRLLHIENGLIHFIYEEVPQEI